MSPRGFIKIANPIHANVPFTITGENLASLLEWKPRPAEAFTVSTQDSALFRARLMELSGSSAVLLPFEEMGKHAPGPRILLLQALPERERMETIIQKTTELGISSILPFKSEKSISLEELDGRQRRSHNWGEVALKAARQSRRPDIPDVLAYRSFEEALSAASTSGLKVMLREGSALGMKELLAMNGAHVSSAAVLVGPEAGLSTQEAGAAESAGFQAASLGMRVLRTETAAIFASGLLRYELGG